jgi:hypothetical protein
MFSVHKKMLIDKGIIKVERDLFDIGKNIHATHEIFMMFLAESKGDAGKALRAYVGGAVPKYHNEVLSNFLSLSLIKKS